MNRDERHFLVPFSLSGAVPTTPSIADWYGHVRQVDDTRTEESATTWVDVSRPHQPAVRDSRSSLFRPCLGRGRHVADAASSLGYVEVGRYVR